jgi:hypothetical protein
MLEVTDSAAKKLSVFFQGVDDSLLLRIFMSEDG